VSSRSRVCTTTQTWGERAWYAQTQQTTLPATTTLVSIPTLAYTHLGAAAVEVVAGIWAGWELENTVCVDIVSDPNNNTTNNTTIRSR
jgi:hypothetical protein